MGNCSSKGTKSPEQRKTPPWLIRCFHKLETIGCRLTVVLNSISVKLIQVFNMIQEMRESESLSSPTLLVLDLTTAQGLPFPFAVRPPVNEIMQEEDRKKAFKNMIFQKNLIILLTHETRHSAYIEGLSQFLHFLVEENFKPRSISVLSQKIATLFLKEFSFLTSSKYYPEMPYFVPSLGDDSLLIGSANVFAELSKFNALNVKHLINLSGTPFKGSGIHVTVPKALDSLRGEMKHKDALNQKGEQFFLEAIKPKFQKLLDECLAKYKKDSKNRTRVLIVCSKGNNLSCAVAAYIVSRTQHKPNLSYGLDTVRVAKPNCMIAPHFLKILQEMEFSSSHIIVPSSPQSTSSSPPKKSKSKKMPSMIQSGIPIRRITQDTFAECLRNLEGQILQNRRIPKQDRMVNWTQATKYLSKIIQNIDQHFEDPKYRTLKFVRSLENQSNAIFMSKVGKFKVSLDILSLIGFKEGMEEGEHIFHLPMTAGLAVFKNRKLDFMSALNHFHPQL